MPKSLLVYGPSPSFSEPIPCMSDLQVTEVAVPEPGCGVQWPPGRMVNSIASSARLNLLRVVRHRARASPPSTDFSRGRSKCAYASTYSAATCSGGIDDAD